MKYGTPKSKFVVVEKTVIFINTLCMKKRWKETKTFNNVNLLLDGVSSVEIFSLQLFPAEFIHCNFASE